MIKLLNKIHFNKTSIENTYHDVIECLVAALEARDIYTSGHSNRVADMTYDIAKAMSLSGFSLEEVHIAAHLHDIGKLGVPDQILNKRGRLMPHEFEQIKLHPEIGYKILCKSEGLKAIAKIVRHHHERWDGKGYPEGLKYDKIPLGARIIAVSDSIDAMTSGRPYRSALSWEACIEEVLLNKGIQFDPVVVETAEKLWGKWMYQSQKIKYKSIKSERRVVF
ncbi:MAG: phosphohydrolase [Clostridia bacterium BRH_c25]|nr:MAG: phosphohydrolase [Clostridia bacterium BRH_c25]